jgi:hypothetical protein
MVSRHAGATRWPSTGFHDLHGQVKVAILAGVAWMTMILLWTALLTDEAAPSALSGSGDLVTYMGIIARIRTGEGYYDAAHTELLAGGFGTLSVFNWRTPFYPTLLAHAPSLAWADAALIGVATVGILMAFKLFRRIGGLGFGAAAAVCLVVSLAEVGVPDVVGFTEVTAGCLILLSACAYGLGWRGLGLAAGLTALFVRELALPYALVCLALSVRRPREPWVWCAGLAAFGGYFWWHAQMVAATTGPADQADPTGWLAFGGLRFSLRTAGFNGALALAPLWVSALYLPLALLGLAGWEGESGRRVFATVLIFLGAFLVVGKPFNNYWGAMYTPLLMLGLPWAMVALRDLLTGRESVFGLRPTRPGH